MGTPGEDRDRASGPRIICQAPTRMPQRGPGRGNCCMFTCNSGAQIARPGLPGEGVRPAADGGRNGSDGAPSGPYAGRRCVAAGKRTCGGTCRGGCSAGPSHGGSSAWWPPGRTGRSQSGRNRAPLPDGDAGVAGAGEPRVGHRRPGGRTRRGGCSRDPVRNQYPPPTSSSVSTGISSGAGASDFRPLRRSSRSFQSE